MKKSKIITLAALALMAGAVPAHANPIVPDTFGLSGDGPLFLLIALSALLVEYLVVRKLLHPWVKFRHALPAFLLINLVSFPLTTILGTLIVWIAEVLPLAIEPPMYRWYLRKIGAEVPNLRTRIIAANLASFIVGVIAYHAIGVWKGV
jgi:hypothetical protein